MKEVIPVLFVNMLLKEGFLPSARRDCSLRGAPRFLSTVQFSNCQMLRVQTAKLIGQAAAFIFLGCKKKGERGGDCRVEFSSSKEECQGQFTVLFWYSTTRTWILRSCSPTLNSSNSASFLPTFQIAWAQRYREAFICLNVSEGLNLLLKEMCCHGPKARVVTAVNFGKRRIADFLVLVYRKGVCSFSVKFVPEKMENGVFWQERGLSTR